MKYLAVLALLFLAGCSSTHGFGTHSMGGGSGYSDYTAKAADGSVKIHRVYNNGNEEWINQDVVTQSVIK